MALGTNQTTTTTAANHIPEIWSKQVTVAFEANLVLADKVMRFDSEIAGKGDTVHVPAISNLVANDKVANTEVTLQAPTEGETQISIDQHKHTAFLIEDITEVQSNASLMSLYADKAAYAVAQAVDTAVANLATGFSNSAGAYNTTLTEAAVQSAVQTLDDGDVPMENRCFVVKPHAIADLRTLDDYVRFDGTGFAGGHAYGTVGGGSKKPSGKGYMGMLYGAPIYMTTQIAQSGNNISNLLIHKEAIGLALQKGVRVQSDYVLEHLGTLCVADTVYGVAELRDAAGVELRN